MRNTRNEIGCNQFTDELKIENEKLRQRIAELEEQLRKFEEEKTESAKKTLLRLDEACAPDLPPLPVGSSLAVKLFRGLSSFKQRRSRYLITLAIGSFPHVA